MLTNGKFRDSIVLQRLGFLKFQIREIDKQQVNKGGGVKFLLRSSWKHPAVSVTIGYTLDN